MSQSTNHILMIRPAKFCFNLETAANNAFQDPSCASSNVNETHQKGVEEFDNFVQTLQDAGVTVHIISDTPEPHTPDSIFPNNWISFHKEDSTICLYPMYAQSRRLERKSHIIKWIEQKFHVKAFVDFTRYENYGQCLEGTGSMILDRSNNTAYACYSPRTDKELFEKFCKTMNFKPIMFSSVDQNGSPVYHTNVCFCIADKYAVICADSIRNETEKKTVLNSLKNSGKEIILLSYEQMNSFAGNMLQVKGHEGKTILVMSSQAFESLNPEQIDQIEKYDKILHCDLTTIEATGGGSARCMMAEIFLEERNSN